jgi:chromosome segregation ATPase
MKNDSNLNNEQLNISRNEYDSMVHTLNQQVSSLKSRLETDKDRHQAEIIALQDNYKTRLNEKQVEVEMIEAQLEDLRTQLERKRSNEFSVEEKDHQKDEEIKELKSQVSILSILKLI